VSARFRSLIKSCWSPDPSRRPSMGTVVSELELARKEGPPRIALDQGNSHRFRKAATVFAHRSKDPATVLKAWGRNKGKADDVLVFSSSVAGPHAHLHPHPGQSDAAALQAYYSTFTDLYVCDKELFAASYEPTGAHPHEYFKRGTVRARRMDEPFAIRTGAPIVAPPLASGSGPAALQPVADASAALLGSIEQGNSGDWILQNDSTGDQWVVDARTMQATYVRMQDDLPAQQSPHTDLLSPSAAKPSSPSAAGNSGEARLTGLGGGVLADCSTDANSRKQAQQQQPQPGANNRAAASQRPAARATVTRASSTSVADSGAF
jgi:hypothetical protein